MEDESGIMREWAFITNHGLVLSLIARNPRITARELSMAIGITERAVRRVIAGLLAESYIEKQRRGRGITYSINHSLGLRHHTHHEIGIGDFLRALGCPAQTKCNKG